MLFLSGVKGHVRDKGRIGGDGRDRQPLRIAKVYDRDVFPNMKVPVSKLRVIDPNALADRQKEIIRVVGRNNNYYRSSQNGTIGGPNKMSYKKTPKFQHEPALTTEKNTTKSKS